MKALLIEPAGRPVPLAYRRMVPFLGLITVASLMTEVDEIRYLDERFDPVDVREDADLVALTGLTHQAPRAYEIARGFRDRGIPVIMGGVHATVLPQEAAAHVDAVILGEAEGQWTTVFEDLGKGSLRKTYGPSIQPELEQSAFPRRDLLRSKPYLPFDLLQATRGCPLQCEFCSVPATFGRKCRRRPVEEVYEEILGLSETFFFVDDNMLVSHPYFERIFDAIQGVGKQWFCLGSLHLLRVPGFLGRMARAGCWAFYLDMGPWLSMNLSSSGLRMKEKDLLKGMIDRVKAEGIKLLGSFVFGYDHDDQGIFERTVALARDLEVDEVEFHILTPFPGTRLYDRLEREGRIITRNWSQYSATRVVFQPKAMSPEALQEGYWSAWREFYGEETVEESEGELIVRATRIFPHLSQV
jgi:radical SAM superfamily enzyme YgiQ (UPF0313 family)